MSADTNTVARAVVNMPMFCVGWHFHPVSGSQKKLIPSNCEKELAFDNRSNFAKRVPMLRNFDLWFIILFEWFQAFGFHENFYLFFIWSDGGLPANDQHAKRLPELGAAFK